MTLLPLGQRWVSSVQVSNSIVGKTPPDFTIPTTVGLIHCGIIPSCLSPYIQPSVTAINLKLGFISKQDFSSNPLWSAGISISPPQALGPVSPPEKWFMKLLLVLWDNYKTAVLWQDFFWLELCVFYLVKSVSVMKLLFYPSGNKDWFIDLLMMWLIVVWLIVLWIQLIQFMQKGLRVWCTFPL